MRTGNYSRIIFESLAHTAAAGTAALGIYSLSKGLGMPALQMLTVSVLCEVVFVYGNRHARERRRELLKFAGKAEDAVERSKERMEDLRARGLGRTESQPSRPGTSRVGVSSNAKYLPYTLEEIMGVGINYEA
ncbi:MAG: hypothetical protein HYW25_01195 [Candidatus Aenigmarchaeota archaeon]|nr:hypothetical protein [Candidatus Aenigmarchaeota archaeon]